MITATALFFSLLPCAIPDVVTLTAVLEEDGAPLDRSVSASFALWDAPDGGASLWSDATRTVSVDAGVLVVELGAAHPLPPHVFGAPVWLEVVVDGQRLSPRVRVSSAPHALEASHAAEASHAETCDAVGGVAAEDLVTHEELGDIAQLRGLRRERLFVRLAGCGGGGLTHEAVCETERCGVPGYFRTCMGACARLEPELCELPALGWFFGGVVP